MPLTAPLQRFVDDELARSTALAERTVGLTLAQLQQPRDGMLSVAEREHYRELVQEIPRQASAFVHGFADGLRSAVEVDLRRPHDTSSGLAGPRGLQLMDESRVEADIEVSCAAQLIEGAADWEMRELQTFTSALAGQAHVSADTNPLQPLAYARALWDACCAVTPVTAQRSILLRVAAGVMSGQMKMAWAAACTRLESQGVEPSIYRTVVLAPGPVVARALRVDVTQPGALEGLLSSMPGGASGDEVPRPRSRGVDGPNPAFEQALMCLESLLQRASAAPGSSPAASPQLREHRAMLLASTQEAVDRQIVELMSRLFEAVLSEPSLPPAFREVIARLQVSMLRVALVDASMLEVHDHPAWRLMNRIGSAAEGHGERADPRSAALLACCEVLVEDMARAPVQDALLYKQNLARLDAFLGEQLREQQARAQPVIDALAKMEQREELEQQISQRLTEQMAPIRTSATVRRFVTSTWARVLAEAIQRFGENTEPATAYLKATDDLLWSLHPPDHPQSRKRLLTMLPGLLQRLRDGFALIGVPPTEQQPLFDELMAVHTEALRPGQPGSEAAPTAHQIVERLRDESVWEPPSRPPFSESLIDLSSLETVPVEALPSAPAPRDDAAARVKSLQSGSRQQLFLQGRWTRVQLLWRSPRGQFLVFAGADPTRPHSVTRRALERLSEEGLMKPPEDLSLVQRAVDTLVNRLESPA
ncbi:DUF1631 family protein [Piscinibacter sp.]|uniref:DUF1631 family protein n=1 Tax=Piscinibacter sp. TaxID=1903157 RepID=UPI002B54EC6A|nr:DUF1631 family protein [Albitalea sp.]HUG24571.1 DUF1631 family protein [Albitalea sp.]